MIKLQSETVICSCVRVPNERFLLCALDNVFKVNSNRIIRTYGKVIDDALFSLNIFYSFIHFLENGARAFHGAAGAAAAVAACVCICVLLLATMCVTELCRLCWQMLTE